MKTWLLSFTQSNFIKADLISVAFYLGSIVIGNMMVHSLGLVTVLGMTFPAGAVAVGLTFSARDIVQERYGTFGCWGWMLAASLITLAFNQQLALASGCAFVISELSDWYIFTKSRGGLKQRLVLSNLVSTPLDSLVFVLLAFGPVWPAIWGQTIIKICSSLLILPLLRSGTTNHDRISPQRRKALNSA
ncbi:hypothetical protein SAMN05660420_02295 [Desulfuromusa kysingii]|uniref:Queuosine precursor transporter n=1 Tax=Desulfuromusa kysingii TaxID=37625 RepID=A0A1H4BNA9_9BACT|nr:VUT family protein [Desulfuromusa kysingii]SEA49606.1 hypothetical protein SAMN05660420_02295 [Desulfuromusa kysingii]